ncbi:MAG: fasciclin domain-containing protein [Bermanella sp.]
MKTKILSLALLGAIGLTGCGSSDDGPVLDIIETAQADERFETLVAAVTSADLVGTLQGDGPFTVFAPTDAAFTALLQQLDIEKSDLLARDDLADILKQHVVSGVAIDSVAGFAANGSDVQTLNSAQKISVAINDGKLSVDGATVVITDVKTSNGVIHVIDSVITDNDAQ